MTQESTGYTVLTHIGVWVKTKIHDLNLIISLAQCYNKEANGKCLIRNDENMLNKKCMGGGYS